VHPPKPFLQNGWKKNPGIRVWEGKVLQKLIGLSIMPLPTTADLTVCLA